MQEKKSLVEEALIQMKQVEEAISENAKGILASTMKEEISQLVKESLSEQDDEEDTTDVDVDTDVDMNTDKEEDVDMNMDMDMGDTDMSMDMDTDSEETPIDLTHASDEEILKVFKAMGEDDGIIIKKDGPYVSLKDNNNDSEYLVKLGESKLKRKITEMYEEESNIDDVIDSLFSDESGSEGDEFSDETIYEIHMDEDSEEEDESMEMDEDYEEDESMEMDEDYEEDESMEMDEDYEEEMEETIYEIEMDEESEEDDESMEMDEESDDEVSKMDESYSHKKAKKGIKAKGIGMGKPKFSYKKTTGGFKEDMKQGTKGVGMGKAKFEYKKGENMGGKSKLVKKTETKESARTLGNGRAWGRPGLDKPRTSPRSLKMESLEAEISMLRQKNEEYRKALNTFREKLNEVATFNSNLAYATRLFTEHSTTKKEKINILRRFDEVETLKESKNLYKSIKEDLTKVESKPMNESVETKMNKNVSTGSSTTLIESKTYENPQFLRIKDLMNKM
jgi:hypothetical protein